MQTQRRPYMEMAVFGIAILDGSLSTFYEVLVLFTQLFELTEIIIYFDLQFLHCVLMLLNTIYKGTN